MSDQTTIGEGGGAATGGGEGREGIFESTLEAVSLKDLGFGAEDGDGDDGAGEGESQDNTSQQDVQGQSQQAGEQQQTKPQAESKFDPMAFALHVQQQNAELTAALPHMIAQAVAQAMAGVLPKPQEAPPPPDPLSQLDPSDPDYHVKRYDLILDQVKAENKALRDRLDAQENGYRQQQQTAAQQQQQAQFVGYVNTELNKAVNSMFQGWPDTPQVQALKQAAAGEIDKAWYDSGWRPEGYTQGIQRAQAYVNHFAMLKTPPPPANGQKAPVQSSRAAATTAGTQPLASANSFWKNLEGTRDSDAALLRQAFRGSN